MDHFKNSLILDRSSRQLPCAAAINQTLQSGQRPLEFPEGTYRIEQPLKIPSGTHIQAHPHARFMLVDGAMKTHDDYLITNEDPANGNCDITISGGIWDGNSRGNPRPEGLLDDGYTGAMMHFNNVRGLTLRNATLQNAEAYYSRFTHVHQFHIEDITLDSDNIRKNNDGIHIGGNCSNGTIRNICAKTPGVSGDDMVALNADDALERTEVRGMTRGPIEDILIENIEAPSCHTFIRLLSVTSPIRNITIRNVQGGCQLGAINGDGARGCRVPVFDEANPPCSDGVGLLENIHISNVNVHKCGPEKMALIDIQERTNRFTVENFIRNETADVDLEIPTIRLRHIQILSGQLNDLTLEKNKSLKKDTCWESFDCSIRHFEINSAAEHSRAETFGHEAG